MLKLILLTLILRANGWIVPPLIWCAEVFILIVKFTIWTLGILLTSPEEGKKYE